MAKITVEEPRSVVEEMKKYKCDNCSSIVNEENAHVVKMWPVKNAEENEISPHSPGSVHLCSNCIEVESYATYMDSVEKRESRMSLVASGLNKSLYVLPTGVAASLLIIAKVFPNAVAFNSVGEILAIVLLSLWVHLYF